MTCSAAPLTSAILSAVDAKHTGAASGLNSAVAQLGGVIVIALVGAVLALRGAALIAAFHTRGHHRRRRLYGGRRRLSRFCFKSPISRARPQRKEARMPTPKDDDHLIPEQEREDALDEALEETFPASDPISPMRPDEA